MSKEPIGKDRKMLRRGIGAGLAAMAVITAAGCQKSPDPSIVKNTDMDKLIEQARSGGDHDAEVSDIAEKSDTYQTSLEDASLGITVSVDAKVDIPETEYMSVFRVRQTDITQEFLDRARSLLVEEEPLYDGHLIGKLRKEYETAPASIDWETFRSDGMFKKTASLDKEKYARERELNPGGEIYYGVSDAQNGYFISLYAQNNENYGNCLRYRMSRHGYIRVDQVVVQNTRMNDIRPEVWRADRTEEAFAGAQVQRYNYIGEYEDEAASLSLEEARKQADELLLDMGLTDFGYYSGDMYCEGQNMYADDGERQYSRIYILQYMRQVDGAFVTNTGESKHTEGWEDNIYVKKDWPVEAVEVRVNDEGIIGFDYNAPIEITETVAERSGLKSFDEAKEIFEKMVLLTNAKNENDKTTIRVDRVILGYAVISEADRFDGGLLVPVWDFMGTVTIQRGETWSSEEYTSVMTVNAVDGSIIDRTLGY